MEWSKSFNVTIDKRGSKGIFSVKEEDVLFFYNLKGDIMLITENREWFTPWKNFDRFEEMLLSNSPHFIKTDRLYIANLNNILDIDEELHRLIFNVNSQQSRHCHVSATNMPQLKTELLRLGKGGY